MHKEKWAHLKSKRKVKKFGGDVSPDGLENYEPLPEFL